jgi:DNA-binding MarR family transcriptional regulator
MSRTAHTRPEPGEPDPFSEDELRAWRGFLRLHRSVTEELSRRLDRNHGLTLAHYGVLITLVTVPDRRMRMTDLAERVLVSPSGMTRAVAWLAEEGLVRRERAAGDGRSFIVELTPAGLDRLREAQVTHHACVRELLLDAAGPGELGRLAAFFERARPDHHGNDG